MKKLTTLKHEFVEFIPSNLNQGIIYISIRFKTTVHLCCCGCMNKVITPLHPTDWKLIFNGNSVSLYPSIGNWSFNCRSHYWIKNNKILWTKKWSQKRIDTERESSITEKKKYFNKADKADKADKTNNENIKTDIKLDLLG